MVDLPEDGIETDARHARAAEQVGEHGARSDRRQLVLVAHLRDMGR